MFNFKKINTHKNKCIKFYYKKIINIKIKLKNDI